MELGRITGIDQRGRHAIEAITAIDNRSGILGRGRNRTASRQQSVITSTQINAGAGSNNSPKGNDVITGTGIDRHFIRSLDGEAIVPTAGLHVHSRLVQGAEGQSAIGSRTIDSLQGIQVIGLERQCSITRDRKIFKLRGTGKSQAALFTRGFHGHGRRIRIHDGSLSFRSVSLVARTIHMNSQGMIFRAVGDGHSIRFFRSPLDGHVGQAISLNSSSGIDAIQHHRRQGRPFARSILNIIIINRRGTAALDGDARQTVARDLRSTGTSGHGHSLAAIHSRRGSPGHRQGNIRIAGGRDSAVGSTTSIPLDGYHVSIIGKVNVDCSRSGNSDVFHTFHGEIGRERERCSSSRRRISNIQRIIASATVDGVKSPQNGLISLVVDCAENIIASSANKVVYPGSQGKGLTGIGQHHLLIVSHGIGGTGGHFAFAGAGVGQVMFQHAHAGIVDGFGDAFGGPVSTIRGLLPGIVHGFGLGGAVVGSIKGVGGVHAFGGAELLVVGPGVVTRRVDEGLYSGDLVFTAGELLLQLFLIVLFGLGGIVLIGVEVGIGGHIFGSAKLHEVRIVAFGTHITGTSERLKQIAPAVVRIACLHLGQLVLHVDVSIKPFGISHCYPPEDKKKGFVPVGTSRIRPVRMRPRRDEPPAARVPAAVCGLVTSMEVPSHVGPGHVVRPHARGRPSSGARHRYG